MTEQEMQFELMKSQEKVNALRQEVAEMNKEREYWQHYRIQAAIAAMQGMISSEFYCDIKTRNDAAYSKYREKWGVNQITREAVAYADALIAELQKKGGQDESNVHSN